MMENSDFTRSNLAAAQARHDAKLRSNLEPDRAETVLRSWTADEAY